MTASKVTLRLQEFVPKNEFAALSQDTNIPVSDASKLAEVFTTHLPILTNLLGI